MMMMMMMTVSGTEACFCFNLSCFNHRFIIGENLFSSVLSNIVDRDDDEAPHKKPVNEDEAQNARQAHDQIYNQNNGQPPAEASSRDLGSAAAMQAFKMFSGGGGQQQSGGGSSALIGLAMGEAMKLFNAQSGNGGNANKGEMLQSAAMMAMKLYSTQQGGNQQQSQGGMGQIMGILGSLTGGQQQQQKPQQNGVAGMLGKFF
jgi:hypothetical protein